MYITNIYNIVWYVDLHNTKTMPLGCRLWGSPVEVEKHETTIMLLLTVVSTAFSTSRSVRSSPCTFIFPICMYVVKETLLCYN